MKYRVGIWVHTLQEGSACFLGQRAVIDGNEALDLGPPALIPRSHPCRDLTRPLRLAGFCLARIGRGANSCDAQDIELLVDVLSEVVVKAPVGRQAYLASGGIGNPRKLLKLCRIERRVLVATNHSVNVEEEHTQPVQGFACRFR